MLIERFTRTGPETLEYEVEVHDPQMYTRSWTVAYPFSLSPDVMYEYACHEGNLGMEGILAGAARTMPGKPPARILRRRTA